jgi:hypothetical protein
LYPILYSHIARLGLPLHLGEPEVPWGTKFDGRAMFKMIYFTDEYDYMEKYSPTPPEQVLNAGASSDDYVRERYHSLTVNCEMPYFYDARIEDTRPSDMTRAEAVLQSLARQKQAIGVLRNRFARVKPLLTSGSPFADTLAETIRTSGASMAAAEANARTSKDFARQATVAEKWDALSLRKFWDLLSSGQFVRMLEYEQTHVGTRFPSALRAELEAARADFNRQAGEVEAELRYTAVPIKTLASVQLLTAFYAMDYVQRH